MALLERRLTAAEAAAERAGEELLAACRRADAAAADAARCRRLEVELQARSCSGALVCGHTRHLCTRGVDGVVKSESFVGDVHCS